VRKAVFAALLAGCVHSLGQSPPSAPGVNLARQAPIISKMHCWEIETSTDLKHWTVWTNQVFYSTYATCHAAPNPAFRTVGKLFARWKRLD
jgi:hypothetical protein